VTRGRSGQGSSCFAPAALQRATQPDGHLRDHYNAAPSFISILYGVVRILRMLSAVSASEEQAGLSDRNRSTNSLGSREMPNGHLPYPRVIPNS
jgi:hypothetical protein